MYPQLPLFEKQGLGLAVMSYDGRMHWGLTGDWDLVPDLDQMSEGIGAAFDELREAAFVSSRPA